MLLKSTILQELNKAKIAHERWVKRADHLVGGFPANKEFIPLEPTTCAFGRWLYGEIGQQIRFSSRFRSLIEEIEIKHDNLHDVYGKIYKIFFIMPEQRSLLHKILTLNSKNISKSEMKKAHEYFYSLQKISIDMVGLLEKLESLLKESSASIKLSSS